MEDAVKDPLPHHEQQELCTTRLPYRQGRKLTAVKVYTVNNESNHLLIFGVPSINLRQETKALFIKFGKLTQFTLHKHYKTELFTDTYHAVYENVKSARIAKKMLDTKNFYGGNLHVCYAPELETVKETSDKLVQRQNEVLFRLKNLKKEEIVGANRIKQNVVEIEPLNTELINKTTLNMGNENVIYLNNNKRKHKNDTNQIIKKKTKIYNEFTDNHNAIRNNDKDTTKLNLKYNDNERGHNDKTYNHNKKRHNEKTDNHNEKPNNDNIEIIDFTSTEKETLTNINEALNYNKFGNEVIKKIECKPLNVIKFNINKK